MSTKKGKEVGWEWGFFGAYGWRRVEIHPQSQVSTFPSPTAPFQEVLPCCKSHGLLRFKMYPWWLSCYGSANLQTAQAYNLRVISDSSISFITHIHSSGMSHLFHPQNKSRLRSLLAASTVTLFVQVVLLSGLDHCNLLSGPTTCFHPSPFH